MRLPPPSILPPSLPPSPPQSGAGGQGGHDVRLFISFFLAGEAVTVEDPLQGGLHHPGRSLVTEPSVGSSPPSSQPLGFSRLSYGSFLLPQLHKMAAGEAPPPPFYSASGGVGHAHPF